MIGTVLKVLGNIELKGKNIAIAIATLLLLAAAGNAFYDLLAHIPTLFLNKTGDPDWQTLIGNAIPLGFFVALMLWFHNRYKHYLAVTPAKIQDKDVPKHRGIVLALSSPRRRIANTDQYEVVPQDEITVRIKNQAMDDIYRIQSLGQLCKAIYHHHPILEYIWLLATPDSHPYHDCIRVFVQEKMAKHPPVIIIDPILLPSKDDNGIIRDIKGALREIFSEENLRNSHSMQKSDVVVDVSGGTKTITIGMVLGALNTDIYIQYVEQMTRNYGVIPLKIDYKLIYDKLAEHFLELYSQK